MLNQRSAQLIQGHLAESTIALSSTDEEGRSGGEKQKATREIRTCHSKHLAPGKKRHRIWYPPGARENQKRLIRKHSAARRPLRNGALGKG